MRRRKEEVIIIVQAYRKIGKLKLTENLTLVDESECDKNDEETQHQLIVLTSRLIKLSRLATWSLQRRKLSYYQFFF